MGEVISQKTYTLAELSSASGVPSRKIRYYIQEGLVPRPLGAGRKARYAEAHLATLQVISALRREHLPLGVIREYLDGYDPANLSARAEGGGGGAAASEDRSEGNEASEADHARTSSGPFRGLKGPQLATAVLAFVSEKRGAVSSAVQKAAHRGAGDSADAPATEQDASRAVVGISEWRRLAVSPEVELHVAETHLARLAREAGLKARALTGEEALALVMDALGLAGGGSAAGPGRGDEADPTSGLRPDSVKQLVRDQLIDAAVARRTLRYAEVAGLMGVPTRGQWMGTKVGGLLDQICEDEVSEGRPMLSAVVVGYTGRPGKGFFALAEALGRLNPDEDESAFWARELEAVYGTWACPREDPEHA